jgi:hypothetical protein
MMKLVGLGIVVLLAALGANQQAQAVQRTAPVNGKASSSKGREPTAHVPKAKQGQSQSRKPAGHVVAKRRGPRPTSGQKTQAPVKATPKKAQSTGMAMRRNIPVAAAFGYTDSATSEDQYYDDFEASFEDPEVVDEDYAHSFDADWSRPQGHLNSMAVQGYQLQYLKKAGIDHGDVEVVDLAGADEENYEMETAKTRTTEGQAAEKRNFLFEAMNEGYYEPQYVMKRGGLSTFGAFDRPSSPDQDFMSTLKRFLGNLLQRTSIPDISRHWLPRQGEKAHRTDKLTARWKSIDCATLDMRLRVVGSIYEGHRNQVLKLQDRNTQRLYAYKTYGNQEEFYAELEMFLWLDHPLFIKAVCQLRDVEAGKAGILFDYVDGTTSMAYARTANPEQLQKMSAQLFLAVEHLHWLGIVHADLKPENVLVMRDGTIQVIDFGFAVHLPQSRKRRGTHTTMAPELHSLVPGRVHEGIDWWAYGSTVGIWYGFNENYRLADTSRFIPMDWKDFQYVAGQVPSKFTPELRSFLHIFFQPHPESRKLNNKRLLRQIREQPFFEGFDWSSQTGGILA